MLFTISDCFMSYNFKLLRDFTHNYFIFDLLYAYYKSKGKSVQNVDNNIIVYLTMS